MIQIYRYINISISYIVTHDKDKFKLDFNKNN